MNLRDFVTTMRDRWKLTVLTTLVGIGAACAYVFTSTPVYSAQTQLFVSTTDQSDVQQAYQGGLFSQQRVKSYADIVASPLVLREVISDLGLPETPQQLRAKITTDVPLDTVLINVNVQDTDPARAAKIADTVSGDFSGLVGQLETDSVSSGSPVKVTVTQPAVVPTSPVAPKKVTDIALGLLLGLGVGIGGAVLLSALDTRVKSSDDLGQLGVSVLASVSRDRETDGRPLIVDLSSWSPRAEAYRQLRTSVRFLGIDQELRSLVVSSSVAGEGKTTTACNLAVALAQTGKRVVIVDADLRRPRLTEVLRVDPSIGLTNVLVGSVPLRDTVQQWREDLPLYVIASGETPPNPSELLGSQRMQAVVRELTAMVDVVIFDTPPLLPVTDAAVLAPATDGVLLVARSARARRQHVTAAVRILGSVNAHLLGVVLNGVRRAPSGYSGYYHRYDSKPARGRRGRSRRIRTAPRPEYVPQQPTLTGVR